jgi:hypothetical protein
MASLIHRVVDRELRDLWTVHLAGLGLGGNLAEREGQNDSVIGRVSDSLVPDDRGRLQPAALRSAGRANRMTQARPD